MLSRPSVSREIIDVYPFLEKQVVINIGVTLDICHVGPRHTQRVFERRYSEKGSIRTACGAIDTAPPIEIFGTGRNAMARARACSADTLHAAT